MDIAAGYVADLEHREFVAAVACVPVAMCAGRLHTSYNHGEQPMQRSFLLGLLSPPFLQVHSIALQWFEQTEMAFIQQRS